MPVADMKVNDMHCLTSGKLEHEVWISCRAKGSDPAEKEPDESFLSAL